MVQLRSQYALDALRVLRWADHVLLALQEERGRDMVFGVEPRPCTPKKGAAEGRPSGAFGQEFPQNVPSAAGSTAVAAHGVKAVGPHAEGERVDSDGLPHVGAVLWPGQSYYTTLNKTNGALRRCAGQGPLSCAEPESWSALLSRALGALSTET